MPVVELAGVTKAYESKVAVRDLSLSIEAGQMFGLLGPNGAGKTSSIRMMMGITMPDSGRINLFEKPFDRKSLDRVGYLPEERGLYKKMKVLDQLVFFGRVARRRPGRRPQARRRLGRAHGDLRRPRQKNAGTLQGHAAEDPVHRHAAARSRSDRDGRALQRPRSREHRAAAGRAARTQGAGQGHSLLHPPHGPGGEALRLHLPHRTTARPC